MTFDPKYCQEEVWDNFRHHQCSHKAVVFRDGKGYCKKHDPIRVAEKRKESEEKYRVKLVEITRKSNAVKLYTLLEERLKTNDFEVIKQLVLDSLKEETNDEQQQSS